MKNIFGFWEKVKWYDVDVLNEREVRAAAWILFASALTIFISGCLTMEFFVIKIFITIFMIDFFIRVIINPKYAPSMILGRFFVRNQKVEYVWAPQKRFAWAIWLIMSVIVFFIIVILNKFGLPVMVLCFLCLILLFLETSFGICLWCNIYNKLNKDKAKYCPGWVCELKKKEPIQNIGTTWIVIVILSVFFIYWLTKVPIFKTPWTGLYCSNSSVCWSNESSSSYTCPITWKKIETTKSTFLK